jgi:Rrf2 family protein
MNKLNRRVEYALMALKYFQAHPTDKLSAKELAERLNTSFDVFARVLQILTQKNVLISEQGVAGGYRLNKDLQNLSLYQLVEMIEGPTQLVKCLSEESSCEIQESCNIAHPMRALNEKLNEFYKTIPVSDLLFEVPHV